jgi:hypothetical protein
LPRFDVGGEAFQAAAKFCPMSLKSKEKKNYAFLNWRAWFEAWRPSGPSA